MIDVLLIDGEPRTLQELSRGLRIQSHNIYVVHANNAGKAAQYLRTAVFDVIVTELHELDSEQFELLHLIKKIYPHIPVIVMSAVPSAGGIRRLPFAKHVEKNLDLNVFADVIRAATDPIHAISHQQRIWP